MVVGCVEGDVVGMTTSVERPLRMSIAMQRKRHTVHGAEDWESGIRTEAATKERRRFFGKKINNEVYEEERYIETRRGQARRSN